MAGLRVALLVIAVFSVPSAPARVEWHVAAGGTGDGSAESPFGRALRPPCPVCCPLRLSIPAYYRWIALARHSKALPYQAAPATHDRSSIRMVWGEAPQETPLYHGLRAVNRLGGGSLIVEHDGVTSDLLT